MLSRKNRGVEEMVKFLKDKSEFNLSEVTAEVHLARRLEALKVFKHKVASALLEFTDDDDEAEIEARLSASLLFLTHLSQEIIRGIANSDPQLEEELLLEAIKQSNRAYKTNFTKKPKEYFH